MLHLTEDSGKNTQHAMLIGGTLSLEEGDMTPLYVSRLAHLLLILFLVSTHLFVPSPASGPNASEEH